jgi:hypothetical protein
MIHTDIQRFLVGKLGALLRAAPVANDPAPKRSHLHFRFPSGLAATPERC